MTESGPDRTSPPFGEKWSRTEFLTRIFEQLAKRDDLRADITTVDLRLAGGAPDLA
ncbi:MAG: hypothetical protein WBP81_32210 [Solirubrobacteraceae bacterium]